MKRSLLLAFFAILCVLSSFILKDKQNISVIFIGDSITAGSTRYVESPPKYAGAYLKQQLAVGKVKVSNAGISGYTTVNYLPGQATFEKVKVAADTIQQGGQSVLVFSIMLGTNDSAIKGPAGAPVAPADYRHNLKIITDSLLARYPFGKVVINYPIWYSDSTANAGASYLKEGQNRVLLYHKQIDTLIINYKKEKQKRVFMGDKQAYGYFKENYKTDFKVQAGPAGTYYLHPNLKGDKALGEFWAQAILKALK